MELYLALIDYYSKRTFDKYSTSRLVMAENKDKAYEKVRDWFDHDFANCRIDEIEITEHL